METTTQNSSTKKIQLVITGALILVLLGIVGGYIYYGMRLAKQGDTTAVVETNTSTTDDTAAPLTTEQKMAILQLLSASTNATNTPTVENREKILNSLSTSPSSDAPAISEEQKQKILESLSN